MLTYLDISEIPENGNVGKPGGTEIESCLLMGPGVNDRFESKRKNKMVDSW